MLSVKVLKIVNFCVYYTLSRISPHCFSDLQKNSYRIPFLEIGNRQWAFLPYIKNGEALESFMGIRPSRRNFPEFQMGFKFGVASDQLSEQPHQQPQVI